MELGERFVNATRYPRSMKTLKFIAPIATFWSVLIAGVLLADSAMAKSLSAQVQSVTGTASYQLPGEQSTPITPGTQIPEGAVITTGAGASIDVFLGRNTGVVRLTQNSILRIEKLQSSDTGGDRVTETALQLQEGELFGNVNKQSAGSSYVITLPDGNLEVAKSRFQVTYQAVQAPARWCQERPGRRHLPALHRPSHRGSCCFRTRRHHHADHGLRRIRVGIHRGGSPFS